MIEGTVYKSTGNWYRVVTNQGEFVDCRVRGRFRLKGQKLSNPVAVGDRVVIDIDESGDHNIVHIYPRKSYLVRQSPQKRLHLHLLAANLDQVVIVNTWIQPTIKLGFMDRFLLLAEIHDVPPILIFNKMDLLSIEDRKDLLEMIQYYTSIGIQVLSTSTISGEGISEFKSMMHNKTSLLTGHSGVGKSSLVNSIQKGIELKTEKISNYSGKGQHTTTFAEMHDLSSGGRIIDSPGLKNLSFNHLEKMDVSQNFRDFFLLSRDCRFDDCLHISEPHCAVKEKLMDRAIPLKRYDTYCAILQEIEDQNYWEINKDF